jgi:hypothetical protein
MVSKATKEQWLKIQSILSISQEAAVLALLQQSKTISVLDPLEQIQVEVSDSLLIAVAYGD